MHNGTQIKTVPIKEKIKELFEEYYNDETMPVVELEDKVLALFDVVGGSEQLVCDHPYEYLSFGEDCYCECEKCNTRLS